MLPVFLLLMCLVAPAWVQADDSVTPVLESVVVLDQSLETHKQQVRDILGVLPGGVVLREDLRRMAEQGASPAVRQRAWLDLARLCYRRGLYEAAETALSQVSNELPDELISQRLGVQVNLLLAQQRYHQVVVLLSDPQLRERADVYLEYNLALAMLGSRRVEEGIALLRQLGSVKTTDEAHASLRDLANLSVAGQLLGKGEVGSATSLLRKVRLQGMASGEALLMLGEAYARQQQWRAALGAWQELTGRAKSEAVPPEVWFRFADGLERFGDKPRALRAYEMALAAYAGELARLNQALKMLDVSDWMEQGPAPQQDKKNTLMLFYLSPLLASHRFQEAKHDLQVLRQLVVLLNQYLSTPLPAANRSRIETLLSDNRQLQVRLQRYVIGLARPRLEQRLAQVQLHQDRTRYGRARLLDEAASRRAVRP